ncbi:hypothetical protein [Pedobacter sp. Leaf250]|uniref:hypothetical protein n=1 Tax=Pedobacter sp. Leaf250 TaxID=2876559 RepID=UPI001E375860|nr:hypothetical protein [Pedobacter sp. Leaf250]
MEDNKTVQTAEKIKAAAMGFIGAGIFSQGTLYFRPQSSYNVPRILYPVFELLGNKGLAVAMIILGLLLLYFGFSKWKKFNGSLSVFSLIGGVSLALFFSILLLTGKKQQSTQEILNASNQDREKAIAGMQAMDKPDFGNKAIDNHFVIFEISLKHYKEAVLRKDDTAVEASQAAFAKWNERASALMLKLPTIAEKQQMALYVGKLNMKWQEVK